MRVFPFSEYYECGYCDCRYVYLSFWSASSILVAGAFLFLLVIFADNLGVGNHHGLGARQAFALTVPSLLVLYGLFLLFKR